MNNATETKPSLIKQQQRRRPSVAWLRQNTKASLIRFEWVSFLFSVAVYLLFAMFALLFVSLHAKLVSYGRFHRSHWEKWKTNVHTHRLIQVATQTCATLYDCSVQWFFFQADPWVTQCIRIGTACLTFDVTCPPLGHCLFVYFELVLDLCNPALLNNITNNNHSSIPYSNITCGQFSTDRMIYFNLIVISFVNCLHFSKLERMRKINLKNIRW